MQEPSSHNHIYDIYIEPTPHTISALSDLTGYEHLLTPNAIERLLSKQPGFLELDLRLDIAVEFFKRLHVLGVWGDVVPVKYRHSTITVEMGYKIAKKAITKDCASSFPGITFEPVRLYSEGAMVYKFYARSDELHKLGLWEPDAVFASVDKIDGHIWEQFEYYDYMKSIGLGEMF